MPTVLVKIYTNDGEGHFNGFDPEKAELTMVMSHNLACTDADLEFQPSGTLRLLDVIYKATNLRENPGEFTAEYNRRGLRSLSVGDVVVIGEQAWAVSGFGWKKITADQLNGAIIWDDELGRCPNGA